MKTNPKDLFSFHFTVIFDDGSESSVSIDSDSDDDEARFSAISEVSFQYQECDNIIYNGVENNYD